MKHRDGKIYAVVLPEVNNFMICSILKGEKRAIDIIAKFARNTDPRRVAVHQAKVYVDPRRTAKVQVRMSPALHIEEDESLRGMIEHLAPEGVLQLFLAHFFRLKLPSEELAEQWYRIAHLLVPTLLWTVEV
jgi:hypothetical protein